MIYYLAAKYRYRIRTLAVKHQLQSYGYAVQSRWLTGEHDGLLHVEQCAYAIEDLEDIDTSDCLVCLQFPCADPEASTGRHLEFGYALAKGKRVILVGARTSVFHYLPKVQHFATLETFLSSLKLTLDKH